MNIRISIVLIWVTFLTGCVTMPDELQGERYSQAFYPIQAIDRSVGAPVRWGGMIVETRPEAERTCIEVLARELDARARPEPSDQDLGRFLACDSSFLDPEIYTKGREVTTVGRLAAFQTGQVGEFEYRYPRVAADAIHLWPERQYDDDLTYRGGYFVPYYGWGFPYYFGYARYPVYRGGHYRVDSDSRPRPDRNDEASKPE